MTEIELPILRQSERGDFKMCPAKWNWRWNEWLVPKMRRFDARWFGTMWHLLWATVYTPPEGADGFTRAITKPEEIHQLWDELVGNIYTTVSGVPQWSEDDELEWNDARALGHIMIDGQLKEWNLDPQWEVLGPEHRFSANVPYNKFQLEALRPDDLAHLPPGKFITRLVGTYDLPVRDHTDYPTPLCKVVDWKTTSRRENLKQLNKDDQTGTYLITAGSYLRAQGKIGKDESIDYMIFSFARKAKPASETKLVDEQGRIRNKPQKNHYQLALKLTDADIKGLKIADLETIAKRAGITVFGEVSKNQGSPLFWRDVVRRNQHNRQRQLERIADEAEVMAKIRAGSLPVIKSPGDHCNWGCDYSDLCDIDEDGGDTESFIKDVYKKEDPYADHRLGAQNSKRSLLERELDKR
ncbi:exonuclease [Mycobacterium phage Patience]|uniref:PD-(D/E)XK endonuclease-like domain-containing protein n=1 Tax=Mycobacterium phage Patience TaxID=1074308 RepID=G1JWJ2_9CAUD|nr:exonuclease [Mycobacterium phage Patience]AEL97990.1 hypothetical protein PATIENCE_81 [Mycobacterium phage Patience]